VSGSTAVKFVGRLQLLKDSERDRVKRRYLDG
jgi:hypothetical protein